MSRNCLECNSILDDYEIDFCNECNKDVSIKEWNPEDKFIGNVTVNDKAEIEVYECVCGYHFGVDATYLEQVGEVKHQCPSCKTTLTIQGG